MPGGKGLPGEQTRLLPLWAAKAAGIWTSAMLSEGRRSECRQGAWSEAEGVLAQ